MCTLTVSSAVCSSPAIAVPCCHRTCAQSHGTGTPWYLQCAFGLFFWFIVFLLTMKIARTRECGSASIMHQTPCTTCILMSHCTILFHRVSISVLYLHRLQPRASACSPFTITCRSGAREVKRRERSCVLFCKHPQLHCRYARRYERWFNNGQVVGLYSVWALLGHGSWKFIKVSLGGRFVETVHLCLCTLKYALASSETCSWLNCVHGANCDMHARQQQQGGAADRPCGVFRRLRVHTQQQSLGI